MYKPNLVRIPPPVINVEVGQTTGRPLMQLLFDPKGRTGVGTPISPERFQETAKFVYAEIQVKLREIATLMQRSLRADYKLVADTELELRDGGPGLVKSILKGLFQRKLETKGKNFVMNVFDMNITRDLTSGPEWGLKAGVSLFDFFERSESTRQRRHGSRYYGFVSLKSAMAMARIAATMGRAEGSLQGNASAQFLQEVQEVFQGRYEGPPDKVGIMVNLSLPLFHRIPQFGLAGDFIDPHPGVRAWNILADYPGPRRYGAQKGKRSDWLTVAMSPIFDEAAKRMVA